MPLVVLHGAWTDCALHLWGEIESPAQASRAPSGDAGDAGEGVGGVSGGVLGGGMSGGGESLPAHPFAASPERLRDVLATLGWEWGVRGSGPVVGAGEIALRLPSDGATPLASPTLTHVTARRAEPDEASFVTFITPTLAIAPGDVPGVLELLESDDLPAHTVGRVLMGDTLRFFAAGARLVRHLVARQRFAPTVTQSSEGLLAGLWQPWFSDTESSRRVSLLASSMPAAARAVEDSFGHDGWAVLEDYLARVTDAWCRAALLADDMTDAIDGRDPGSDAHVAWLTGLLGSEDEIAASPDARAAIAKHVRQWIGGLEQRSESGQWQLCLTLGEPLDLTGLEDFEAPGDGVRWTLTFQLQSVTRPEVVVDAADVWLLPLGAATVEGERIDAPQDVLLKELGRAARLYKPMERALHDAEPTELRLSTPEAYRFLREVRPVFVEQGISVVAPEWWDSPTVRVGARLLVESEDVDWEQFGELGAPTPDASVTRLGLNSLVSYKWQLAVGDTMLTMEQFERLAAQRAPLVRVGGKWVEIRQEDIRAAMRFIRENPGGDAEVARVLRLAFSAEADEMGVSVLGIDATGWVQALLSDSGEKSMPIVHEPLGFIGSLRPYQVKGLSWLAFLDRFGLGACLADDMGLGKTVQLLALLAHERSVARRLQAQSETPIEGPGPTLLVVPMSVVGNWTHETKRFTPELRALVHHGPDRPRGKDLSHAARDADVVITTYALAHRDREDLGAIPWRRVVLDEAQNIKNPSARQTSAIRSIPAPRRIALTGTPLENRLSELWSIMEFLNPGFLGGPTEFRRRFALPIERYHDQSKAERLRALVQPFILRRLKSDPTVIADLPDKVESKEYCYLSPEQAALYRTCVSDMLKQSETAEGIKRRGIVLAGLMKLKQVCNHPAHFLRAFDPGDPAPDPSRSGKCLRLMEMLEELVAEGEKALVFTQFRRMGDMLVAMLEHHLDRDVLFLHGGTPAKKRQKMIERFQDERDRAPVFVLSLRAGGLGLNLTSATHVFHFDRWWNPAVESQATDRAYRIGQTRTVHVHKFVVSGTLEERIDSMIEQKMQLAQQVIASGEEWLTELDTEQLRSMLALSPDAVGDDDVDRGRFAPVGAGGQGGDA